MRLARLAVRDVRNLARVDLELPPEGMVVVGENGHGKTNLLVTHDPQAAEDAKHTLHLDKGDLTDTPIAAR